MRAASRYRSKATRKTAEAPLLERALAAAADAILVTDNLGVIVWANDAFSRLSGYSAPELVGRTPSILKSGKQNAAFYRDLWQTIFAGNAWRGELVDRRKDGSLYIVDEVITPLRDAAGTVTHYVAIQHDITQRRRRHERERYLAYHDVLTGLPNRAMFLDVLEQSLSMARRSPGACALLYVDIDNFKSINDTFGHHYGDRLLVAVAQRLSAAVRKTDTVARLGGDEFAVLQSGTRDADVASSLARKLLRGIAHPFELEGKTIRAAVSIGIAIYPTDAVQATDLLKNADQAMYYAKHLGRNRYQTYAQNQATARAAAIGLEHR